MARTARITEERILEAAREVFLAEGFGAQTAKIAQRAGVSEGSIFKRFATKEALFYVLLAVVAVALLIVFFAVVRFILKMIDRRSRG